MLHFQPFKIKPFNEKNLFLGDHHRFRPEVVPSVPDQVERGQHGDGRAVQGAGRRTLPARPLRAARPPPKAHAKG